MAWLPLQRQRQIHHMAAHLSPSQESTLSVTMFRQAARQQLLQQQQQQPSPSSSSSSSSGSGSSGGPSASSGAAAISGERGVAPATASSVDPATAPAIASGTTYYEYEYGLDSTRGRKRILDTVTISGGRFSIQGGCVFWGLGFGV